MYVSIIILCQIRIKIFKNLLAATIMMFISRRSVFNALSIGGGLVALNRDEERPQVLLIESYHHKFA